MATNAPQDDWHKTGLRLPKELHHQLHEAAATAGRSYNAEIVARLQGSFDHPPAQPGLPPGVLEELERLFDEKLGHQQKAYIDSGDGGRMRDVTIAKKPPKKASGN